MFEIEKFPYRSPLIFLHQKLDGENDRIFKLSKSDFFFPNANETTENKLKTFRLKYVITLTSNPDQPILTGILANDIEKERKFVIENIDQND